MIPSFSDIQLSAICDVLGDTNTGLTGSEIGELLARLGIEDQFAGITKRKRLYEAIRQRQVRDNCGNNVVAFIQIAMAPIRYVHNHDLYKDRQYQLNNVLSFCGYQIGEDGLLKTTSMVMTLTEAEKRAKNLKEKLITRNVHSNVLKFCKAELLQNNYFHAVFESTKSVAEVIRIKSGSHQDGASLVDEVFNINNPLLAINTLTTSTEQSEQKGFSNLLKGLFGTFRNTTAHAPKITWNIDEQDALDILTFTSFLHRRLDYAVPTRLKSSE